MTSLVKSIKDLFATEPQKSLRKVGIFDESDTVTDEGMKSYITWLIINDTKFQADVVNPLVEALKEDK